jgi:hypothetical protein
MVDESTQFVPFINVGSLVALKVSDLFLLMAVALAYKWETSLCGCTTHFNYELDNEVDDGTYLWSSIDVEKGSIGNSWHSPNCRATLGGKWYSTA